MKKQRLFYLVLCLCFGVLTGGCTDPGALLDKNTEIVNNNWSYINKIKYQVKIDDTAIAYNIYLNLRVTADYRYSNLFVMIRQTGPDKKTTSTRYEFPLADKDGEWYGEGSGNIYSFQMPFRKDYFFPKKGVYYFEIEQNMRDNPLHEVSDVGLRVEKVGDK
jgi:gliding motility-associated lipoprotein GldH